MKKNNLLFIMGFLWISLIFCQCSINQNNISSGTGVGNPSTTTTISIIADTGLVSFERVLPIGYHSLSERIPREIPNDFYGKKLPIIDKDSMVLIVTSAFITADNIHFIRADEEVTNRESEGELTGLSISDSVNNSGATILNGPFVFDALTGKTTPSLDTITLHSGKYKSIKIHIVNTSASGINDGYAIILGGTFTYKDTVREFSIKLTHDIFAQYKYKGPPVTITKNDTAQFSLVLNADHWLNNFRLKHYLDKKNLSLDKDGNLIIDKSTDSKHYKAFKNAVRKNIIKSGILFISAKYY